MKNIKFFLALLGMAVAFTACYNEENVNIGDTTVQFQSATMRTSEVTTALNIPIEVTGAHHSTVKVNVQYVESNGLKDDSNVIITDRTLLIPAGVSSVNLETRLAVSNDEVEDGRVLTFQITGVEGAKLGDNSACQVSLKEASPIEGSYALTGLDLRTGSVGSTLCTLTLSESDASMLELNFNMGATVLCPFVEGEEAGDYIIQIPGLSEVGQGLSLAFFDASSMNLYSNDFTGYYDGETRVITLSPALEPNLGMCFVDLVEMGLYYAWTAYTDPSSGETIPLQMIKQ